MASPTAPFTLGVASGDPDHHSVVLWTRLAPDPLNAETGGMPVRRRPTTTASKARPSHRADPLADDPGNAGGEGIPLVSIRRG
ncbi:PhoD-like phosphatase N-terminal domain-containing protein [Streptomyces sp. NPDC001970]